MIPMRSYIVEFCIFTLYMVFSISWVITGVLGPEISKAYGLSTQETALLSNIIVFAKIFGAGFTGFLMYKFGLKNGYLIGCAFISVAIFQGLVNDFFTDPKLRYYALLAIRFCVGLGSATALVCITPIAQKHFAKASPRVMGAIFSLNISSNTIGTVLAAMFAGTLVALFNNSFENVLVFFGWINLAILALYYLSDSKDAPKAQAGSAPQSANASGETPSYFSLLKTRIVWGMMLFYIGPILFLNFIGLHFFFYLKSEVAQYGDMSPEDIALCVKYTLFAFSVPAILSPYAAVWAKKYLPHQAGLSIISFVLAAVAWMIIRVDTATHVLALAAIAGTFFGFIIPYLLVLPTELKETSAQKTGYISSLFWTMTFVFLFLNSQFLAFIFDYYATYRYAIHYLAFLLAFISPLAVWLFLGPSQFKSKEHR